MLYKLCCDVNADIFLIVLLCSDRGLAPRQNTVISARSKWLVVRLLGKAVVLNIHLYTRT